jgi:LysR family nitrogen assimilation transcriptional regulator
VQLEALRLLLVVVEQQSFTRAASKLGMRQSALSRQVQRLEQEFDTLLLYRHGRGVRLTDAGEKLHRAALAVFDILKSTKEELSADSSKFRGTVVLGLPPSFGATISTGLVRRFQTNFPEAHLKVVVGFSGTLLEWLEAGRIDVGVLYDARRSRTLLVTPLLRENLHLIEAPTGAHIAESAELAELGIGPFVIPTTANGMRKIIDAAVSRLNISMHVTAEIDSLDAIKEMVEGGTERSVLPFGAVHREVNAGRLTARRFTDPHMQALLVLATPLHQPVSKLAAAVLRLVEQEVGRCVDQGVLSGLAGASLQQLLSDKARESD